MKKKLLKYLIEKFVRGKGKLRGKNQKGMRIKKRFFVKLVKREKENLEAYDSDVVKYCPSSILFLKTIPKKKQQRLRITIKPQEPKKK